MLLRVPSERGEVFKRHWRTRRLCFRIPSPKVRVLVCLSWVPWLTGRLGLFAGLSLEGTVLIERKDANREFYGSPVPARDILGGRVPPPEVASKLYEIIEAAEGLDESGLPEAAYVPTATGDHIQMNRDGNHMVFDADSR